MLYNDLKYVNVANEIEVHTTLEFKNWIISVTHGGKVPKFGTHVVEDHSEGIVS